MAEDSVRKRAASVSLVLCLAASAAAAAPAASVILGRSRPASTSATNVEAELNALEAQIESSLLSAAAAGSSQAAKGQCLSGEYAGGGELLFCEGERLVDIQWKTIPKNLTLLKINATSITKIRNLTFFGKAIHNLVIESNPLLDTLEPLAFKGIQELSYLSLKHNKLKVMPPTAGYDATNFLLTFKFLDELKFLLLNDNDLDFTGVGTSAMTLTRSSEGESVLPNLQYLCLLRNPLSVIEEYLFEPLSESPLSILSLRSCHLEYIHKDGFLPVSGLRRLDVFNNYRLFSNLRYINHTRRALASLGRNLDNLSFGANVFLKVPREVLHSLKETLVELNLDENVFTELGASDGKETFPPMSKLRSLNLDGCRIQEIHDDAFRNLKGLESLSLRWNYLYAIPAAAMLPTLVSFAFAAPHDSFENGVAFDIGQGVFEAHGNMANLRALSLTHASLGTLREGAFAGLGSLTSLKLDKCDVVDIEAGAFEDLVGLKELSLAHCSGLTFLPSYKLRGPAALESLDITDIRVFPDDFNHTLHSIVPINSLPAEVDDDNNVTEQLLLTDLRVLNLTASLLNVDSPMEFIAFDAMPALEEVVLDRNQIVEWSEPVLAGHPSLRSLKIRSNLDYVHLSEAMVEDFAGLEHLDLSRTQFVCNNGVNMFMAMSRNVTSLNIEGFYGGYGYDCKDDENVVWSFTSYNLDGTSDTVGGYPADRPDVTLKDYINILIPLGVLFVICPLVAISAKVGYDHRWYFQYRLARYKIAKERRGQGKRKHKDSSAFAYDAFVSYNEVDSDLVYDHLVPQLDDNCGLRLCLHHRDFAPGRTIFENIVDSLEKSRSCVIVLSKDYAKSAWCRFEAQMAQQLFSEDDRAEKTIVVVPRNGLDGGSVTKELRAIVKLRTYLEWRDEGAADPKAIKNFVRRMRLALNRFGDDDESPIEKTRRRALHHVQI